jgi:hypothetical protein
MSHQWKTLQNELEHKKDTWKVRDQNPFHFVDSIHYKTLYVVILILIYE